MAERFSWMKSLICPRRCRRVCCAFCRNTKSCASEAKRQFVLTFPPLRERGEDIPFLVHEIAQEFSHLYGCPAPHIPDKAMQALATHSWPGNIRQLRNVLEHCFIIGRGKNFSLTWLEEIFALDRAL